MELLCFSSDRNSEQCYKDEDAALSERLWLLVHSDLGAYLIGAWYRPPVQGEVDSIRSLRQEWSEINGEAVGTIILGDMNIHHVKWLKKSNRNSAEGEELHQFCKDTGMQQIVQEATRGKYKLDLVLTDVEEAKCKVLPPLADHNCVLVHFDLPVPGNETRELSLIHI